MTAAAAALWASIVRTVVPIIVGTVLGWAVALNVAIDPQFEANLTAVLSLAFSGVYYIALRLLETYVSPKLGWLLGLAKTPATYTVESPAEHRA